MLTAFYGIIIWSLLNISVLDIAYGSVRGGNSLQYDKGSSIHMKKKGKMLLKICAKPVLDRFLMREGHISASTL